jgi:hypothetical protein|tara:strand:- start:143 stop:391 length:249 start_codon:yes stop_codon:yes gene_type:complete
MKYFSGKIIVTETIISSKTRFVLMTSAVKERLSAASLNSFLFVDSPLFNDLVIGLTLNNPNAVNGLKILLLRLEKSIPLSFK